ncbi:hypothetical protein DIPPA_04537 [Diplonema papillatum]|nr:hypothetical protein DIPPA_04537 [Diplonema papillatum]
MLTLATPGWHPVSPLTLSLQATQMCRLWTRFCFGSSVCVCAGYATKDADSGHARVALSVTAHTQYAGYKDVQTFLWTRFCFGSSVMKRYECTTTSNAHRIRNAPSLNGAVIGVIQQGQVVLCNKERATLDGQLWIRVQDEVPVGLSPAARAPPFWRRSKPRRHRRHPPCSAAARGSISATTERRRAAPTEPTNQTPSLESTASTAPQYNATAGSRDRAQAGE